jgi:hypothetical protein
MNPEFLNIRFILPVFPDKTWLFSIFIGKNSVFYLTFIMCLRKDIAEAKANTPGSSPNITSQMGGKT